MGLNASRPQDQVAMPSGKNFRRSSTDETSSQETSPVGASSSIEPPSRPPVKFQDAPTAKKNNTLNGWVGRVSPPEVRDKDLPSSVTFIHQEREGNSSEDAGRDSRSPGLTPPTRPVRCPGRKSAPISHKPKRVDHDEDVNHMKKIYDMRTWDMYIRITEARKKKTKPSTMISGDQTVSASTSPTASPMVNYHHNSATTSTTDDSSLTNDSVEPMVFDMDY